MNRNRNKIIAISIFTIALILLAVWIGFVCFAEAEPEEAPVSQNRMSVVIDGMELFIPREYHCYPDDSDLLLYDNSGFAMRLRVLEDSFEELLLQKDTLIPEVESKGYRCLSSLEEQRRDARSYLYFTIDTAEGIRYVIYSNAGADSHFGILADIGAEEPKAVLDRIHSLLAPAQETERENTSIYDLLLEQAEPVVQEETFYSQGIYRNAAGREILSYEIPEGFYVDSGTEGEIQGYTNREDAIHVTLSVKSDTGSAEEWILRYMESAGASRFCEKQTDIQGRTVYYFAEEHEWIWEEKREQFYHFYAAIDLEDGLVYWLTGSSMKNENALELETYREFLSVERLEE